MFKKLLRKIYYALVGRNQREETMEEKIESYRKSGAVIGENCSIYSFIGGVDACLLTIGNNVLISNDVKFLMHDSAIINPSNREFTDVIGRVTLNDECFVGWGSIILPGVELAKGTIVGAGSVVTKSVRTPNCVIAGNPAKILCTVEDYVKKNKQYAVNLRGLSREEKQKLLIENGDLNKRPYMD